jgi:outer membrane protein OmpA-like peptidoglycan-associated protein
MARFKVKTFLLAGLVLAGSAGMAHAEAEYHAVVRDSENQIVHDTEGSCVRTKWMTDEGQCTLQRVTEQTETRTVQHATQKVETRSADKLTQEDRTVYFEFNRANLSPEAQERLGTLAKVLKSDQSVREAKIVGYADRIGSSTYNESLSQKRAETVRDYLVANGYTNARVTETRWVGKSEPSTNCPAEARTQLIACLQDDRRVEVEIGYVGEGQISDAR